MKTLLLIAETAPPTSWADAFVIVSVSLIAAAMTLGMIWILAQLDR